MHRNKSVSIHRFSMIPRADIPRSAFKMQKTHKTTFDAGVLYPIFCEEVLPGDNFRLTMTSFARLATPLFPTMDNCYLECFWFFCPNRLVWTNWVKFMGEQDDPGDSISFNIPQTNSPNGGYTPLTLFDYFGLPTVGQVTAGESVAHSVLPLRMYYLIWNEWFRDENLQDSLPVFKGDGPDTYTTYGLQYRGKRHDYFTSCLPAPQKGAAIGLFAAAAPVVTTNIQPTFTTASGANVNAGLFATTSVPPGGAALITATNPEAGPSAVHFGSQTGLQTDLSSAITTTINQLRQAFQVQKLLERDARGGTRYTEIIRSHFGVISPDARLQRPEYLGGGSVRININPVAQTSATAATGTDPPQGNLAAIGTGLLQAGFTQAFTEHGYVMGLINVRTDLTYQQGLRRHWSRLTRYDFYFPVFAMLGEQAVPRKEIYCTGNDVADAVTFGYQERWAEYRYCPSEISGLFRSTTAQTIDPWHYAQRFLVAPALNAQFIQDTASQDVIARSIAVGPAAGGQQFIMDTFFDIVAARPMPMYSVPGMIDHF